MMTANLNANADPKPKKVMILGASSLQVPIIRRARDMGYYVIVVAPNPAEPGFAYADEAVYADVLNGEQVLAEAKKRAIDGIVTDMAEAPVRTVAYVAESLGLPGVRPETARLFTNKYLMRELCAAHGLPHPRYRPCTDVEEAVAFLRQVNTKVVLKPLDSSASRGVFFVETEAELRACFAEAIAYSKTEHTVIVEEYISGVQFTVDTLKLPSETVVMAVSEEKQFEFDESVAKELKFSYSNPTFDFDLLRETNNKIVDCSGLSFGFTHAEYRYHNGAFYLIEITCRGGGVFLSSHIAPYVSGIDNYYYLLKHCVGEDTGDTVKIDERTRARCAVLHFFDLPEGVVDRIVGEDYLKGLAEVPIYEIHVSEGDVVKGARNGTERAGFYIACCESADHLTESMENIEKHFKIIVRQKNPMNNS